MNTMSGLDAHKEREAWVQTVRDFCNEVAIWAASQGWQVKHEEVDRSEEGLGIYRVPMVTIQTGGGAVMVEPVAREVMGATGRIDLFAYPTLFRVMVLRSAQDGRWRIRTDSGIFLKEPWTVKTFVDLVTDLTAAPDESPAYQAP
jgi:hypothetical protein